MKSYALETEQELTYNKRAMQYAKQLLKAKGTVTADEIRKELGLPSNSCEFGTFFKSSAFRDIAEPVGLTISTYTTNPIRVWGLKKNAGI